MAHLPHCPHPKWARSTVSKDEGAGNATQPLSRTGEGMEVEPIGTNLSGWVRKKRSGAAAPFVESTIGSVWQGHSR
jgi:hypothetical protein